MEFWTSLIEVTDRPSQAVIEILQDNCTHVDGPYWIMEGDVDTLRDEGVRCKEIAEGAVESLGGLTPRELKKVCLDSYGVSL